MIPPHIYLNAMRADTIPAGESGLWFVSKATVKEDTVTTPPGGARQVTVPAGRYTQLWRVTMEKLHLLEPGELVMNDLPYELKKHLAFVMRAHGRVLVTGLGLGCVVRGLLINPRVIKLVMPHMPSGFKLIQDEAVSWCERTRRHFDCAWHDLHTIEEDGEPKLQLVHGDLIKAMHGRVKFQGAWEFPRFIRRAFRSLV
jgi:hypothetical protein